MSQILAFNTIFLFYTDPGSGALIFQLILATLLGSLFYLRKLKDLIFKKRTSKEEQNNRQIGLTK